LLLLLVLLLVLLLLLLLLVLLLLLQLGLRLRLRLRLQRGLRLGLLLRVRVRVRGRVATHCDFREEVKRRLGLGLRARRLAGRRRGGWVCVCRVCARPFFDLGEALLEAFGDKVEFAVGRLRVA
jgi:hypothetical protein